MSGKAEPETYFVTARTWESIFWNKVIPAARIIVDKVISCRDDGHYLLHDFVLLPERLDLIISPTSTSLESCVRLIKGGSSAEIHKFRGNRTDIWQPGYNDSELRDLRGYRVKADYINASPVVAKLIATPQDWEFGSASGKYQLDPIPQRLKPLASRAQHVAAKAPTPKTA